MSVRSPERQIAPDRAAAPAPADVERIPGKYLSITSFRRNGSGVATPVWFATEADRLFVLTALGSGKVRRIRWNPFVSIAACSARGRLRSEPMTARAEILPSIERNRRREEIGDEGLVRVDSFAGEFAHHLVPAGVGIGDATTGGHAGDDVADEGAGIMDERDSIAEKVEGR